MSDSERVYAVHCAEGHTTCLTFRKAQVKEHLDRGVFTFYCIICDEFRKPAPEELAALRRWTDGE